MKNTAAFIAAIASMAMATHARAADFTWLGGVNNKWSEPRNWFPSSGVPTENDVVLLAYNGPALMIDVGQGTTIGYLQVASGAPGYTIGAGGPGGQSLGLESGMTIVTPWEMSGDLAIDADLVLEGSVGASAYWFVNGGNTGRSIIFRGDIGGGGGLSQTINFSTSVGGDIEVLGSILDGSAPLAVKAAGFTRILLAGDNEYSGETTIFGRSTLTLGSSDALSAASVLSLTSSTLKTDGFDGVALALKIVEDCFLDFGNGESEIAFTSRSAERWYGSLTLLNFDIGIDSLRFGTSATTLTPAELALIRLPGYAAGLDDEGYVTFSPVPEPSSLAMFGFLLLGVLGLMKVRRKSLAGAGVAAALICNAGAANFTWTGAVNTSWSNAGNWSITQGAPSGQGDTVIFGLADRTNVNKIDLGSSASVYQMRFGTPGDKAYITSAYQIGTGAVNSQTLTIMRGGGIYNLAANPILTFNARIVLGDDAGGGRFVFSNVDRQRSLKFYGNISGAKTGVAENRTLDIRGGGRFDFYGGISDGGGSALGLTIWDNCQVALFANNSYTGATVLTNCELSLGDTGGKVGNIIPDTSDLIVYNSIFNANGLDEEMGMLMLASNMFLDFGTNYSSLSFADSSGIEWNGGLYLTRFRVGFDQLRFGESASALTDIQLSKISLPGYSADLDAQGYVVFSPLGVTAVPEPAHLGLAGMALLLAVGMRRKVAR